MRRGRKGVWEPRHFKCTNRNGDGRGKRINGGVERRHRRDGPADRGQQKKEGLANTKSETSLSTETIFDLEVESEEIRTRDAVEDGVKDTLRELSSPPGMFGSKLLEDVRRLRSDIGESDTAEEEGLAKSLASMGYLVDVMAPPASSCSKALNQNRGRLSASHVSFANNNFLAVKPTTHDGQTEYLVEPHFRDQFVIQSPTERYSEVLHMLPEEYVGPVDRLMDLIAIVCKEMADAFATTGRLLPPWRSCERVQSKWKEASADGQFYSKSNITNPVVARKREQIGLEFKALTTAEVRQYARRVSLEKSTLSASLKNDSTSPSDAGQNSSCGQVVASTEELSSQCTNVSSQEYKYQKTMSASASSDMATEQNRRGACKGLKQERFRKSARQTCLGPFSHFLNFWLSFKTFMAGIGPAVHQVEGKAF